MTPACVAVHMRAMVGPSLARAANPLPARSTYFNTAVVAPRWLSGAS
jgi:hypothetical protein